MHRLLIKYVLVLFCFISAVSGRQALAYEQGTHELLSELAADRSVLSVSGFLSSMGLGQYDSNGLYYHANSNNRKTIQELISQGSYDEDELLNGTSVLFHFYDPQSIDSGSRGLRIGGSEFWSSMEWSLQKNPDYSYQNAQDYFYDALTASTEQYRNIAFGKLFTAIGHVIHHIQDMAQPQHTRNEPHCPSWMCEQIEKYYAYENIDTASLYESYTADRTDDIRDLINDDRSYPRAYTFSTAADFWQEDPAGGSTAQDLGMAAFSSTRFVTRNKNFYVNAHGEIGAPSGFPQPTGQGLSMTPNVGPCVIAGNQGSVSGICKHWSVSIIDPIRSPANKYIEKYVAESITNFSQVNSSAPKNFVVDIASFQERWEILLPRAVSLSAGLINHIFRGRIDLAQDPESPSVWYIRNNGDVAISGSFNFLYDVGYYRASLQTFSRYISAGDYATVLIADVPTYANKVAVAFTGTIGSEAGTAGAVKPYTAPLQTVPCGGSINPSGGIEGLDQLVELGGSSGVVRVSFNAFDIPDSLTITAVGTGALLFSSGGKISNTVEGDFHFDASAYGTTTVRVKVAGGGSKTEWELNLGCPV
jgi:hypothetical protein